MFRLKKNIKQYEKPLTVGGGGGGESSKYIYNYNKTTFIG